MKEEREFSAKISSLKEVFAFLDGCKFQMHLSEKEFLKLRLAVEEIVVNIIHHAYDTPSGTFKIALEISNTTTTVTVIDQGKLFNPLEHVPIIDPDRPLEERPLGGLGIALVVATMDEVTYTRNENHNILTLKKHSCNHN